MRIGFVGVGVMGSRMVKQFLKAGYEVTIFSRTEEKARPLIKLGANRAGSLRELANEVEMICTCLSMPADVEEVYLGDGGLIHHAKAGVICVDFTTVGVETSKRVFAKAKEKGISYLDAPVSGGPEGVDEATLTIMVGGERPSFETVEPLLTTFGGKIEYLGDCGAGTIAKLMNQYLVAVHSVAAAEAMVVGAAHGLNSEQLFNILKVSYGDSRMLRRHMEHYVLDRQFEPGGAMKYLHKDVKLANELSEALGLEQFSGKLAQNTLEEAMAQGLADSDMSAVIKPLEKKCDVVVKR